MGIWNGERHPILLREEGRKFRSLFCGNRIWRLRHRARRDLGCGFCCLKCGLSIERLSRWQGGSRCMARDTSAVDNGLEVGREADSRSCAGVGFLFLFRATGTKGQQRCASQNLYEFHAFPQIMDKLSRMSPWGRFRHLSGCLEPIPGSF